MEHTKNFSFLSSDIPKMVSYNWGVLQPLFSSLLFFGMSDEICRVVSFFDFSFTSFVIVAYDTSTYYFSELD
jgi:hypothetical protein